MHSLSTLFIICYPLYFFIDLLDTYFQHFHGENVMKKKQTSEAIKCNNLQCTVCTCTVLWFILESINVFCYSFLRKLKLNFRCFPNNFPKAHSYRNTYRNSMYKKIRNKTNWTLLSLKDNKSQKSDANNLTTMHL